VPTNPNKLPGHILTKFHFILHGDGTTQILIVFSWGTLLDLI